MSHRGPNNKDTLEDIGGEEKGICRDNGKTFNKLQTDIGSAFSDSE